MELQKGYEVLRFMDQGNLTRITMDYRKGELLLSWLKENRIMDKELLYQWMDLLVRQVCLFHKCQKNQCYRYLSPESVLVTADGQLYLLDLEAQSNAFVMRDMQRREMRQHFMKNESYFQHHKKEETDLYSLGKTIQFLLARSKITPRLSRREEKQIDSFIQKCLGNHPRRSYQNLDKIQKEIPQYKQQKKNRKAVGVIGIAACIILAAAGGGRFLQSWNVNLKEEPLAEEAVAKEVQEQTGGEDERQVHTTADLEETKNQDRLAALQSYLQNNTTADNQRIIEEGNDMELELATTLATAYDREEIFESALYYYGIVTELEENPQQLERCYLRKATIEENLGQKEAARTTYQQAMKKCEKNQKLALQYLTFICKSDTEDTEQQNQELQVLIAGFPELKDTEEFKKLQLEYGIEMEEEKVWIKREDG